MGRVRPKSRLKGIAELLVRPVAKVTPRSGLQNAAYGSLGPLGEGSVGLAIKEGAVDVQSEESVVITVEMLGIWLIRR